MLTAAGLLAVLGALLAVGCVLRGGRCSRDGEIVSVFGKDVAAAAGR